MNTDELRAQGWIDTLVCERAVWTRHWRRMGSVLGRSEYDSEFEFTTEEEPRPWPGHPFFVKEVSAWQ